MIRLYLFFLLFLIGVKAQAEWLVPSTLDPAFAAVRENAFIPWSDPEQSGKYWKELSPKNVPVYYESKPGPLSRDIYIKNPGIGYWVLGGLTEEALFKTHRQKLEIDDTLISASVSENEDGEKTYWALWAPRKKAHLLTDQMASLGISQARIVYSPLDKLLNWTAKLQPYNAFVTLLSLTMNVGLLGLIVVLIVFRRTGLPDSNSKREGVE